MKSLNIRPSSSGNFSEITFDFTNFISNQIKHIRIDDFNISGIALFSLSVLAVSLAKGLKMPEVKEGGKRLSPKLGFSKSTAIFNVLKKPSEKSSNLIFDNKTVVPQDEKKNDDVSNQEEGSLTTVQECFLEENKKENIGILNTDFNKNLGTGEKNGKHGIENDDISCLTTDWTDSEEFSTNTFPNSTPRNEQSSLGFVPKEGGFSPIGKVGQGIQARMDSLEMARKQKNQTS